MNRERHYLYQGEAVLEFEANPWHRYYYNGNRLASSTGVSGLLDKSQPLMSWAVKMALLEIERHMPVGTTVDEVVLTAALSDARVAHKKHVSKAADLGSLVHDWWEEWVNSRINGTEAPELPVNPKIRACARQMIEWYDSNVKDFVFSERKILSRKHLFSGTSDTGFISVRNNAAVSDYKTGNHVLSRYGKDAGKIFVSIALQLSSYVGALSEEGIVVDPHTCERWVFHISNATGKFEAYNLSDKSQPWYTEWEKDYECFLNLRKAHERVKGY